MRAKLFRVDEMKQTTRFVICILFLAGCKPAANELYQDQIINDIFTKAEVKSLNRILSYFDDLVLDWATSQDKESAYHQFMDGLVKKRRDYEQVYLMINPDSIAREELFQSLKSDNFFNEIWMNSQVNKIRIKDTALINPPGYYTLDINLEGKYLKYLDKLAKKDSLYQKIHEGIANTGDIPPSIMWGSIHEHHQFDYSLVYNRLFMAINCISFEENFKSRAKRYLEKGAN